MRPLTATGLSAICAAALALIVAAYPVPGFAQTSEQRAACTPDVFRLCNSEIPNVEKIVGCLQAKRSQLSPKCQAVMRVTRSLNETTTSWCVFGAGPMPPSEQNWLNWCGPQAKRAN